MAVLNIVKLFLMSNKQNGQQLTYSIFNTTKLQKQLKNADQNVSIKNAYTIICTSLNPVFTLKHFLLP